MFSRDDRAHSGRGKKCRNTGAAGANPLGKSSLRHQVQFQFVLQDQLLEQLVFPHVGPDVLDDLSGREQEAVAQSIDAHIVADGRKVLHPLADQGANQIFRNATQSESANHDGGTIGDVPDGLVGVGYDFIHRMLVRRIRILTDNQRELTRSQRDTEKNSFFGFLCVSVPLW